MNRRVAEVYLTDNLCGFWMSYVRNTRAKRRTPCIAPAKIKRIQLLSWQDGGITDRDVRALSQLPDDVGLVLAGHAEAYEQRLRELIAAGGLGDRVTMPGYVPDGDLEAMWRLAACMAFPSSSSRADSPVNKRSAITPAGRSIRWASRSASADPSLRSR